MSGMSYHTSQYPPPTGGVPPPPRPSGFSPAIPHGLSTGFSPAITFCSGPQQQPPFVYPPAPSTGIFVEPLPVSVDVAGSSRRALKPLEVPSEEFHCNESVNKLFDKFIWEFRGQWERRVQFLRNGIKHLEQYGWTEENNSAIMEDYGVMVKRQLLTQDTPVVGKDNGNSASTSEERKDEAGKMKADKQVVDYNRGDTERDLKNISFSRLKNLSGMYHNVRVMKCKYDILAHKQLDFLEHGLIDYVKEPEQNGPAILCWRPTKKNHNTEVKEKKTVVDVEMGGEGEAEVGGNVEAQLGGTVETEVIAEVEGEVGRNVEGEVGGKVEGEVGGKVAAAVETEVGEEAGTNVVSEVGADVQAEDGGRVKVDVGGKVEANVEQEAREEADIQRIRADNQ
eukprot:GHVQ01001703.1.p1 GENE.GHVQ01001703.1~~GHVQ01001703.1.p1  ORF type:complete len:395 (+),score=96.15 GHVQ01001703.1:349-1533(+)